MPMIKMESWNHGDCWIRTESVDAVLPDTSIRPHGVPESCEIWIGSHKLTMTGSAKEVAAKLGAVA